MESLNSILETLEANKKRWEDRYGLSQIAIFGSYTRNQQNAESDLDVLVDFDKPIGIGFLDLAEEMEQLFGLKVDLVSKKGIKERYFKTIEKELRYI